jgi:hypothetical protein
VFAGVGCGGNLRDHDGWMAVCSRGRWARGMAWAFQQAMGLVWYHVESNPR